jgi:Protein O-mannosyl-transferase TMEM260-like
MNFKLMNRIFAAVVFIIALITFWSTVQPSVSFWDCGEFTAASFYLQVPHPPGAPFFLLLGNIIGKLPIADNFGYKMNLISVFSSAFAVMFLYLVAVKLINNYKGRKPDSLWDGLGTYIAAAVGALALAFSDTFWFNAVEAEVYAFSTLLVAAITYLILRWNERADEKDNEKYILMIAYLVGLSTGVHLMSVLTIVPIAMVIAFRKYVVDDEALKNSGLIFLVHAGVILILALIWWAGQTSQTPPTQEEYHDFDSKFKLLVLGISAIIMGIFWKKLFTRNSFYMPLIVGGVALFLTYPGVVKYLTAFMNTVAGGGLTSELLFLIVLFGVLGYGIHYSVKNNKPTLHLTVSSLLFVIIGFTTFAMVIIRANQDPPMNENSPKTFPELESYLNREQYGDFPTFKRRFTTEPHQTGVYTNYVSDLDFFYRYQMNHMMTRYWLWNFAGREGWRQDDGANIAPFNGIGNALGVLLGNVRFGGDVKYSLFGIPFLIGLLGIYFHFKKDWKMASVFMIMFIMLGYLTAFYQNQQQPQPRERDYFYVGAFFVYAIWIAIGVRGLLDLAQQKVKKESMQKTALAGILVLAIAFIPFRMLQANYFTHDRSKNWVPWDYSYNILQSVATNAVLFTNGDNDTFPLWYLQDVEGVRRDVKIVNLSLLNTDWYIKQLKNNDPYNVGTVRLRLSDMQVDQLRPVQWNPKNVTVPTPKPSGSNGYSEIINTYGIKDTSLLAAGNISWMMSNTLTFGDIKAVRVQDLMVKEIVEANNWQRPIYFAVTVSDDSRIGLGDYLKMEGMAFRLVPEKRKPGVEFINEKVLSAQLNENPGFSREYKPGFKFRGLNDPGIFFDNNHKRMVQNYRNAFIRLTIHYLNIKDNEKAIAVLDEMNAKLPYQNLGIDNGLLYEIANLYLQANEKEKYKALALDVEKNALIALERNPSDVESYYNPYRLLLETYENLKEYEKAIGIWEKLRVLFPNDPTIDAGIQKYKKLAAQKDSLSK